MLAIATMTHEKKGDAVAMQQGLEALAKLPYKVYIADGGSSEAFLKTMRKMGHQVQHVQGGLTEQHKTSIMKAAEEARVILYTEPDKYDWFTEELERTVEQYLAQQQECAVVGRKPEVFKTFPEYQQYWEGKLNAHISKTIGKEGDFVYGPKLFPNTLAQHLSGITDSIGWGTLTFLIGKAHRLGMDIGTIYTASPCPAEQKNEDNAEYRRKQYTENIIGFFQGMQ